MLSMLTSEVFTAVKTVTSSGARPDDHVIKILFSLAQKEEH